MRIVFLFGLAALLLSGCAGSKTTHETSGSSGTVQPKMLVLDVRTPEEFKSGHVQGAINVPVDELTTRISQVAPDKDTPIAVHCQSGGRSARAKKALDAQGYTHVQDLGSLAHARQVVENQQQ
jgi:phage shock protein E